MDFLTGAVLGGLACDMLSDSHVPIYRPGDVIPIPPPRPASSIFDIVNRSKFADFFIDIQEYLRQTYGIRATCFNISESLERECCIINCLVDYFNVSTIIDSVDLIEMTSGEVGEEIMKNYRSNNDKNAEG